MKIYTKIRPLLFKFDPEFIHRLSLLLLKIIFFLPWLIKWRLKKFPQKPVEVFGLTFPNPIGLSAGFDNNADYLDALFSLGFGFIEVGGVTPEAQPGNPKPRIFRIPEAQALINRMGFANKGVDYLVERLKKRKVPGIVGVNICKNKETPLHKSAGDYAYCITKLFPYVDFITINISSPNTPGLRDLQSEEYLNNLLSEINITKQELMKEHHREVRLLVKTVIDLSDEDLKKLLNTLMEHDIAGVIVSNTSVDHSGVAHLQHGNEQGGLSGQPLFAKSTEMIKKIREMTNDKLPVIAVGGVMSVEDARAKFQLGASLVQVYTGLVYKGPNLVREIIEGI